MSLQLQRPRRPCDQCRRRKSRCIVNHGETKCFFCTIKGRNCTFLDGPPSRTSASRPVSCGGEVETNEISDAQSSPTPSENPEPSGSIYTEFPRLNGTLGLKINLRAKYVGSTSFHEPALIDLRSSLLARTHETSAHPRVVGDSSVFLIDRGVDTPREHRRLQLLDEIEACVQPFGPLLIDLYFRTSHYLYPVLDRVIFLEKRARSHHEFSPPLLAAVYLEALNWRSFDRVLNAAAKLEDSHALQRLASQAIQDELVSPNLSTLQGGLLLLQRGGLRLDFLHAQLIVAGQSLGIHMDCDYWQIPDWEKGLRRRLAWMLLMQDQWSTVTHGRPPLLIIEPVSNNWTVCPCTTADLTDELFGHGDTSHHFVDQEAVVAGFIHSVELTKIFAKILTSFYSGEALQSLSSLHSSRRHDATVLAESFADQLEAWYLDLPQCLQFPFVERQNLSLRGQVLLLYVTTQLMLNRALLRLLHPDLPSDLSSSIRNRAKFTVNQAIAFLETLQPIDLYQFWNHTSSAQMALIGSVTGLLWATSSDNAEASHYIEQLVRIRWALQTRANSASFMHTALAMFDEEVGDLSLLRATTTG